MLKWLIGLVKSSRTKVFRYRGIYFEESQEPSSSVSFRLADVEQSIGGVRALGMTGIEEMVERKQNLQHQLKLCRRMMKAGDILPFPFERAAILLRKEKRYSEELEICRYVEQWSRKAEKSWDGRSAMVWKSPRLQRCIKRIPKIEALADKANGSNG